MSEIKADTPDAAAAAEQRIHTEVVPDTGDTAEVTQTPAPGAFLAAFAQDWGQLRAKVPLHVNGLLAFPAGAQVPSSHPWVESWLAEGLLDRVGE